MNDSQILLAHITVPVGSIIAFAGNVEKYTATQTAPSRGTTQQIEAFGWMLCDGSSLNASEYPELYTALGNLYGTSGSGNDIMFNLPDLRGQFLRGISTDDASNEKRTASKGGTANGVGSTQKDALQSHQHDYTQPTGTPAPGQNGAGTSTVKVDAYTGIPTSQDKPNEINVSQYETRPTNTFVNYLIKYTYNLPRYKHTL